jgi:mannose-6-phosphate isomerase
MGGNTFITDMLDISNTDAKPCAEYWLGAHPSASAQILNEEIGTSLYELIKKRPYCCFRKIILYKEFGELPYLLKILDVKHMLSIQVHPTEKKLN